MAKGSLETKAFVARLAHECELQTRDHANRLHRPAPLQIILLVNLINELEKTLGRLATSFAEELTANPDLLLQILKREFDAPQKTTGKRRKRNRDAHS